MDSPSSLSLNVQDGVHRSSSPNNLKSRFRKHLDLWKAGLAAKEHWDDEYNFQPGRYAGQGR
ncbi:uncharacterized protein AKAW2_81236S [Aspergillus luchuensis]|uniref:Inositol polyphosphate phosphatase n=2 Tax=Aspergillus kawachii TaxID=1069201 RepID=A0A146FG45_ASPKA|nr:uncharacterized protein AKAW2_81236S [Aspergillus luchuensis]OJZ81679.1 hypothetical protein ASPFODRAFT_52078 [Aspergillus luchuensis CBS 106.47]BCS05435.1 hypothetical protein AKAW2_81236S [Aspergillus luchuensis]BCS16989.1 hypothetical protein ALUC_81196S [Aspergillus luchuensis]GAT24875.1 inositol polyphosphate phosphatase [Aspergillus luchuensis]